MRGDGGIFGKYVGYEPVGASQIKAGEVDVPALVAEGAAFMRQVVPVMAKAAGVGLVDAPDLTFTEEGNGGLPHRVAGTDFPSLTWVYVPKAMSAKDGPVFVREVVPADTKMLVVAAPEWHNFQVVRSMLAQSWPGDLILLTARLSTFGLGFELSV